MNKITTAIFAAIATISIGGAAIAADPILTSTPSITYENVNFDGPYIGSGISFSGVDYTPYVSSGYQYRVNDFIIGAEAYALVSKTPVLGIDIHAGVAVTDNLALYGIVGIGSDFSGADSNSVGIGAEYVLSNDASLVASYRQVYDFGTFNNRSDEFRLGLKFSF